MPAIPPHKTATSDGSWDGPANEARLRSGESRAYYARAFAWRDPEKDDSTKAAYKFIHHEVDGDGNPGPANITACRTGIAVLNGARGGTTIPDADRRGVYNHLASHLRDAGVEPPDLRDVTDQIQTRAIALETTVVDEAGTFSGYAATFNDVDAYGTALLPGAFKRSLAESSTRTLLWGHDPRQPIGIVELKEDERGLYAVGKLNMDVERAREIRSLMLQGAVGGMSIGFIPTDWREDAKTKAIQFVSVDLVEVSLTPFPANKNAQIDDVRSDLRGSDTASRVEKPQPGAPAVAVRRNSNEEANMDEKIQALERQMQTVVEQIRSEMKAVGSATDETVKRLEEISKQLAEARKQLDAVDLRTQRRGDTEQPGLQLRGNESLERLLRDKRGVAVIETSVDNILQTRTTITSSSISIQPERMPGVVPEPRRQLRIRQLLTTIPTTSNSIEFVRIASHAKVVSPQTEGAVKAENELTFNVVTAPVRTIATWIPATKQVLEDFPGLEGIIRTALAYALEERFEDQILLGSGSGQNLSGLVTQATNFTTGLLGNSWTYADVLGRAIQQIQSANQIAPTFVVLNPADAWNLRLMRDNYGAYIFGPPSVGGVTSIWGLDMIVSNAMTAGQFLIGSSSAAAAHLRMRHEATVEISTEHSDYFTRNMIAIRAELRAALVVQQPGAFVKGAMTRSPAV